MSKAVIQLEALSCPSCILKIEGAVKSHDGVDAESVKVLFNASKVKLDFDENIVSLDKITDSIESLGYEVQTAKAR